MGFVDMLEDLVGKVGKVVNPEKGAWEGAWKCTGYKLLDEDTKKAQLIVESDERLVRHYPMDPVKGIPPRTVVTEEPRSRCTTLPYRWFKPIQQEAPAKESKKAATNAA